MQVETKTLKTNDKESIRVNAVIVCNGTNTKLDFHAPILGVAMCEWVGKAFEGYPITYCLDYKDYIQIAKDYCGNFDYTAVVGGNMPLLTHDDITQLIQYAIFKRANLVKFVGGYVFNNNYLKNTQNPQVDNVYTGDMEHYYLVENKRQLNQISKMLAQNIAEYHMSQGVEILGKVTIEPNVEIESGATIFGGNTIKGYSYISSGAIIKENNVIDNSYVGKDSFVSYSVLTNARIGDNCIVMPFCNIENTTIASNTTIESNTNLSK